MACTPSRALPVDSLRAADRTICDKIYDLSPCGAGRAKTGDDNENTSLNKTGAYDANELNPARMNGAQIGKKRRRYARKARI